MTKSRNARVRTTKPSAGCRTTTRRDGARIRITPKHKDAIRQVFRGLRAMVGADDVVYIKYALVGLLEDDWRNGSTLPVFADALPEIAKRARLIRQRAIDGFAKHAAKLAADTAKQAALDAMTPEERAAYDASRAKREAARVTALDAMVELANLIDSNPDACARIAAEIAAAGRPASPEASAEGM